VALVGVGWQSVELVGGRYQYRGGRLLAPRGLGLGEPLKAVRSVQGLRGFVGVDFIDPLGEGKTTVIEINPRPTTSVVGLCRLFPPGAIARAWLRAVRGEPFVEELERVAPDPALGGLVFSADGRTEPVVEGLD
jgi:predicted ATP-grasp superfamily ATP-dependent carboligase